MQISRGGMWAITIAAVSLVAVLVSYTPASSKGAMARMAASAILPYDGYYEDSYYYTTGNAYEYGGTTGSSVVAPGYYEEYYYEDYSVSAPTSATNAGWSFGSGYAASPFPTITSALSAIVPYMQRANVVVANPYYYARPQTVTLPPIPYNTPGTPTCTLTASPASVAYGGSTTLSWTSQHADRASLDTVGAVATVGVRTINNVVSTRTYGISVVGRGGQGSCYALVSVGAPVSQLSCLISTNPAIIRQGESASLSWGSAGSVSATLTGGGASGTVPASGGITISPHANTTYTLNLRDQFGNTRSCSTGILVQ